MDMTKAPMHKKRIAPSLLSADFSDLRSEIEKIEKAGADLLHLDIMDGHFVPNLTMGPLIVKAIQRCTNLTLDCHLMIENPSAYIEPFRKAGAHMISFHCEAKLASIDIVTQIKKSGAKAGVALNPQTPIEKLAPYLHLVDYVLIMSVHPGFGGQAFIEEAVEKVRIVKDIRTDKTLSFNIEVDGGIKLDNIHKMVDAGADIFVVGSGIFDSKDYGSAMTAMKEKIHG